MREPAQGSASNASERRIAACLKACDGVPTEKLEEGIIVRLVAACIRLEDPCVREIIDELVPRRARAVGGR